MIYQQQIDRQILIAECKDSLAPVVQEVFQCFAELAQSGHILHPGTTMQFGWSRLVLQSNAEDAPGSLRVCEPEYFSDPFTGHNLTLDITLSVLCEQVGWLRELDVPGVDIFFDSPLVAVPGALQAQHLFALREEPATARDSGWALAPVPAPGGAIDTSSLQSFRVYELLKHRPELLSILTLPVGYLVEFDGNRVQEISDQNHRVRWSGRVGPLV
jgi:hypothetical protein